MKRTFFFVGGYSFEFTRADNGACAIQTSMHSTGEGYINSPEREAAIDGFEAMLLAMFYQGVKMEDPIINLSISSAIAAIDNHYED